MSEQVETKGGSFRGQLLMLLQTDEEVKSRVQALLLESEVLKELHAFREDANNRFETLATELRELREDTNRRFETLATELRELREDTNRRFEAVNERFEAIDKRFEALIHEMSGMRRTLDALGSRWGIQTEEAVRKFADDFITKEFGLTAQSWSYPGGQIDLIIKNGQHYLIEIKSTVNSQEVEKFSGHIAAYQEQMHIRAARKLIVTAHATSDAFKEALAQGIEIITG